MKVNFFSALCADGSELHTSIHYLRHGSVELELNPLFQNPGSATELATIANIKCMLIGMKCKLVIQLSQSKSLAVTTSWWMQSEYVKGAKPQALLWKVSLSFQVQLVGVWLPLAITLPANAQNEVKQLFPCDITQSVSKIFQACQPRVERLHNYSTQDVNIHLSGHLCSARQFYHYFQYLGIGSTPFEFQCDFLTEACMYCYWWHRAGFLYTMYHAHQDAKEWHMG